MAPNLQPSLLLLLLVCSYPTLARAAVYDSAWDVAQATAYGEGSSGTINGGACGYGVLYDNRYGSDTAAISSALFEGGAGCGACYEVRCEGAGSKLCKAGGTSVKVTATNFCPPAASGEPGHWCNPPSKHFDLSESAYAQIAAYPSDAPSLLPIAYRRVPCTRQGGMQLTIDGHASFNQVLLTNVGGSGQVKSLLIKGSKTPWHSMTRNWGSNWQTLANLRGQSLSFQVILTDGTVVTTYDAAPSDWQFGQTFQGKQVP